MRHAALSGRFCTRVVLVLGLALAPWHSARAQATSATDSAAVHAILERYLHGLRFNDVAAFRIVSIEVTGTIASARVRETYPTSEYVNVLSLVRTSGRWWIVNKVYWARPR